MIKVNELRIGNWVERAAGMMQVTGITEEGVHFSDGDIEDFKYPIPIPLTPEILEKCGCVKDENNLQIELGARMRLWFNDGNPAEMDIIQDGKHISFKCAHIKYLHQLQNLYFALSGNELNIDLK